MTTADKPLAEQLREARAMPNENGWLRLTMLHSDEILRALEYTENYGVDKDGLGVLSNRISELYQRIAALEEQLRAVLDWFDGEDGAFDCGKAREVLDGK